MSENLFDILQGSISDPQATAMAVRTSRRNWGCKASVEKMRSARRGSRQVRRNSSQS